MARDIVRARGGARTERDVAERVAAVLDTALARERDWLWPEHRAPGAFDYRQHVLHVAGDGSFSIVALVWEPGQRTCIHDHVCWCVVGVYQGREVETSFDLHEDADGRFLVPSSSRVLEPGEVSVLVPPDEDIHQVACAGTGRAISIHVYGTDIAVRGTSINHRFEDVPLRPHAAGAPRASWRAVAR